MDLKSPKSEPAKSFEKPNTEKAEKTEVASKPNQKPDTKPKNKIEPRKIDPKKEPKHKLQPRKIDPKAPPKHKLVPRKIDPAKEPKHRLQPRKIDPKAPSRHIIEPRKIDHMKESIHKIQPQRFTPEKSINKTRPKNLELSPKPKMKIEQIPTSEPKNTAEPEVKQFSPEQIRKEIKKIDWKSISENWNIANIPNRYVKQRKIALDPTKDPSIQNPLYKHKQWLQTLYNNPDWNLTGTKLGKICGVDQGTISRWRKKLQIPIKPDLAIKKLYFDGKSKECGRCHEIKPHDNFTFRRKNEIKYPKSTCKKCDDEQKQIFALKNKIKVVENLYNGKLGSKCPECNTGPEKLPALEFHHTNPALKKTSWHPRMYKNWEETKEILEKEKVKILCKNCHTKERTKTYNNYENLIKKSNFNLNSSNEEIKSYIRTSVPKAIKYSELTKVVQQIKKFTLVNKLYKGKCVGCEQITTQNNLPALQFHHKDVNDDKSKLWSKIQTYELKQIKNELINKNCVSLCGNCHQMIHSTNFKTQYEKIIGLEHWGQVKTYFNVLEKNVKNFQFNGDLTLKPKSNQKEIEKSMKILKEGNNIVKNRIHQNEVNENRKLEKIPINFNFENNRNLPKPLNINELGKLQNTEYGYGEAWMKYLVHIAKLTQEKTIIRTKDIADSVGVITRNVRKNLVKLANKEFIITSSEHNDRHILLSDLGLKELHKIKKLKKKSKKSHNFEKK